MTKEEILENLQELFAQGEIELQVEDTHAWVYDYEEGKEIEYNLNMNFRELLSKIYTSDLIPKIYRPHKTKLASYLWRHMPRDAFWTLNKIYLIWGTDDNFEDELEKIRDDQEEPDWDFDQDYLGLMWHYKNCAIINVGRIFEVCQEEAEKDETILGWSCLDPNIRSATVITTVHELRHLMLDTNIVLSEDEFPVHLSAEEKVEEFGRDIVKKYGCGVY